jgi:hypothetical protein
MTGRRRLDLLASAALLAADPEAEMEPLPREEYLYWTVCYVKGRRAWEAAAAERAARPADVWPATAESMPLAERISA